MYACNVQHIKGILWFRLSQVCDIDTYVAIIHVLSDKVLNYLCQSIPVLNIEYKMNINSA